MRSGTYFFFMTIFLILGIIGSGEEHKKRSNTPHNYRVVLDNALFSEFYITDSITYHNDRIEFYEKYDSVGMVIYNSNIDKIIKE
jgi:hypothetical protein